MINERTFFPALFDRFRKPYLIGLGSFGVKPIHTTTLIDKVGRKHQRKLLVQMFDFRKRYSGYNKPEVVNREIKNKTMHIQS